MAQGLAGDGGHGGLVVFSGDENPVGWGQVNVNGGRGGAGLLRDGFGGHAGTIFSRNPAMLSLTQSAYQYDGGTSTTSLGLARPLTEQTAQDEILTHSETLVLLRRNSDAVNRPITLFGSLAFGDSGSLFSVDSKIRSVNDPLGNGAALALVLVKTPSGEYPYRNYVVGSSADNLPMSINAPAQAEWQGINNLSSLTIANEGIVFFSASSGSLELNAYGGSHASMLATGGVFNGEGGMNLGGYLAGGTLSIASGDAIF